MRILWVLGLVVSCLSACDFSQNLAGIEVSDQLKVVIIRHGEKPADGDNLSCQGLNRALQLPKVLIKKFNRPDDIYVPSLNMGKETTHARMLQTVTPLAIQYNLKINSKYDAKDFTKVTKEVLNKKGTVLMVWQHSAIHDLAKTLGVQHAPKWQDEDFDSIWVIQFSKGQASLTIDHEQLSPATVCNF
ncbi:MAG: histidine phosphatase family protein [Methylophilus sp.]|nr:histidine phosphatase family protein [Methylophilus sp.]